MKEIYEIEDLLEELAEEIEPHLSLLPKFLSNLKETGKSLSIFSMASFFPKIESIRHGIFEVAKIEEFYSLNILFRSLIEHFVKAQYLWMKTLDQKNDEIGIDYWLFGKDQENIDYAKSLQQSYSLIGINLEESPVNILKEMGVISKDTSANQIRKKTDQFKYKSMTHFITESLKSKESGRAPILGTIFPRYAELSSCVHGGPDSVSTYETGPENLFEIINMSVFASLYIRWSTFILCFQYEKKFEAHCQISQKYLNKFTRHKNQSLKRSE
jgi:hypothetical protein